MTRPGWRRAVAAAAGLLLLTAVPIPAQDEEKQPPSPAFLQGTEAFRRIIFDAGKELSKDGFQPLKTFNDLDDPKNTILIVFGDARRLAEVPRGIRNFVQRGGALFLATDRALSPDVSDDVARLTGFTVSGDSLICGDVNSCYRGLDYCPLLAPQEGAEPDLFRDLLRGPGGLSTVATNAPSYLEPAGAFFGAGGLPARAWLPGMCGPDDDAANKAPDPLPFGVGGDVGAGRVLLLADHSIFINEMLMQQDNGNVEFSYNCLKWMAAGPDGPRTKVLFVEDGKINTKFDVPLKEVPDELLNRIADFLAKRLEPFIRSKTKSLEEKVRSFDEQEWFNNHHVAPRNVLQGLLVGLAVLVVLYGCWKVGWKARHRSDLQGPLLATALHRLAPSGAVVDERRRALVRGNNLWEPARDLARQCLADAGAPPGANPPPVAVRGGWLRRWTIAGRLKRLWRLAYGPPVRVPLDEWRRLLREVQELKGAFADGTVQWR